MEQTILKFGSTCHPQIDGQAEVANRNLAKMVGFISDEKPKHWDLALHQAKYAFYGMVNRSRGKSPFDVIYTKASNNFTDISILNIFKSQLANKTAEDIVKMLDEDQEHLEESQ